jgi:hypothetical protein
MFLFDRNLIFCHHFQVERQFSECSKSLQWNKDRVRELEMKLKSMQEVENVSSLSSNVMYDSFHLNP